MFPENIIQTLTPNEAIVFKDGTVQQLDENNEFVLDNVRYVIYKNYTTTRTHHKTVCNFETTKYAIPAIISYDAAINTISGIINLSATLVHFTDTTGKSLITESWDDAFTHLIANLNSILNTIKDKENEAIIKSLDLLIQNIDAKDVQYGANISNIDLINAVIDTKMPVSHILSTLIEYLTNYINLDESTINHRLLNGSIDNIFSVIAIITLYNSTFCLEQHFTNKTALIGHKMCEFILNLLTDRLTKELFIDGRNLQAVRVKTMYEKKFPFLLNSNPHVIAQAMQGSALPALLEQDTLKLYPYIMLMHTSDTERLRYLYNYYASNKKVGENLVLPTAFNWPTESEYFNIMSSFVTAYDTPIVYDMEVVMTILPTLLNMESSAFEDASNTLKSIEQ